MTRHELMAWSGCSCRVNSNGNATTARSISWWNRGAYPSLDPESSRYDPGTIRVGWMLVVLPSTVVDEENPPTPSPAPARTPKPS